MGTRALKERVRNQDPELKAIQAILASLEGVPEDRRGSVLSYVSDKLHIPGGVAPDKTKGGGIGTGREPLLGSIEDFVAAKNPQNHYQRVACLAYYLETKEGTREFDTAIITTANSEAGGPKLGNATQVIADAESKYGFFAPTSERGKKRLTVRGKKVVEALPDQDAVKRVLDEIPFRRTKARKGGKKKPA